MTHTFNLVEILNPFKPNEQVRTTVDFARGATVEDLYPALVTKELAIGLNGKVIEPEHRWCTEITDGDYLVVCPIVSGGGGDDKSTIRIIALIAVAVIAPYAAPALAGAGATASTIAMYQAVITVAGGMLVNALIPAPEAKKSTESPTYGVDGAKNTSAEGIVTPVCYGTNRVAGNIINNYVVNDGETQWLYMLLNAGEGPIGPMTGVQLNELPIEGFDVVSTPFADYELDRRFGTGDQTPIPWFADTITPQSVAHRLTPEWHVMLTSSPVDQVRFDFAAPSGFFIMSEDFVGQMVVGIEFQYRISGSVLEGDWAPLTGRQLVTTYTDYTEWNFGFNPAAPTYAGAPPPYRIGDLWYADYMEGNESATIIVPHVVGMQIYQGVDAGSVWEMKGAGRNVLRRSFISTDLPQNSYDFRVRRGNVERALTESLLSDTIYLTDLNEIVNEDVAHRFTGLLALKVRLNDQLSGMPNVTYLHHGKLINVWNNETAAWEMRTSSNPAWVSLDLLTHKRYGGGAPYSRFDLDAWRAWANYCTEKNLQFNGIFDTQSNVWDSNQAVMRCGHASLVRVGTRYTVAIERDEAPVMMFSVANMIEGSFEESWSGTNERSNEVEGTFVDAANNYKQRTIRVYDRAALAAGKAQRTSNVELRGVTSAQQAWDDLNILLNMNRYIQRTVKFSTTMEALGCTVGNVVLVQHDMPKWGSAGRLEAGCTTTTLNFDRKVEMEFGKVYKAFVHHSALLRYTGTVASIVVVGSETTIFLNSFDGVTIPDRIKVAGKDVRVQGIASSGPLFGVSTDTITGVTVGATYELWNTDVIETRTVNNPVPAGPSVEVTTVTLATALSAAPEQFTNWMYGEVNKVAKPFRVKAISGSHDYHRDLTCVEFNASVYDPAGAVPTLNYSDLGTTVDQVTISGVSESVSLHGMSYKSRVTVNYDSRQQTYKSSNVYLKRGAGDFEWMGKDIYSVTVDGAQGELLTFKVVAMDVVGKNAPESTAPTVAYTVLGKETAPGAIQTLSYSFVDTGIKFTFMTPPEQDWLTVQASTTATFDTGTVLLDSKVNSFTWAFQATGTHRVWFRTRIQGELYSSPVYVDVVVLAPATPTIASVNMLGRVAMVKWADSKTSQTIRQYEVRVGGVTDLFADATQVGIIPRTANAMSVVIENVGPQRIFVRAIDQGGNFSSIATTDVVVVNSTVDGLTLLATSLVVRNEYGSYDPSSITLTAVMSGLAEGSVASFSTFPAVTLTGTGNTRALAATEFATHNSIAVTATVTVGAVTYSDVVTLAKLVAGSDAISFVLSNESMNVPANAEGIVSSYAGADTYLTVYRGATVDTLNWTFSKIDTNLHSTIDGNHVVVDWMGLTIPGYTPFLLNGEFFSTGFTYDTIYGTSFTELINDGTDVTISPVNAKFSNAVQFPGTGLNYLRALTNNSYNQEFGLDFVVQMQAFVTEVKVERQFLIGVWSPANARKHSWALLIDTDGNLNLDYRAEGTGSTITVVGPPITVGAINQIGWSSNGTGGIVLAVDGVTVTDTYYDGLPTRGYQQSYVDYASADAQIEHEADYQAYSGATNLTGNLAPGACVLGTSQGYFRQASELPGGRTVVGDTAINGTDKYFETRFSSVADTHDIVVGLITTDSGDVDLTQKYGTATGVTSTANWIGGDGVTRNSDGSTRSTGVTFGEYDYLGVLVYDGEVIYFKNGVEIVQTPNDTVAGPVRPMISMIQDDFPQLYVGQREDGTLPFEGALDEVRISKLTPRDIVTPQTRAFTPPTQFGYSFDEVEDGTVDHGWVDITASRSGFSDQVRRFSVTKSRRGVQGITGLTGVEGTPGVNGTFFHVAYATSADGSAGFNETSGPYIGTYVDTTVGDSTSYLDYNWMILAGTDGIPGVDGSNGLTSYLHVKYSNDGGATFTASSGETPGSYLGLYVDLVLADSTNVADYTWSLIKGADGVDGDPGPRGNVNIAVALTGTAVWGDAAAEAGLIAEGYGAPQTFDVVTLYKTSAGFSETRYYSIAGVWTVINQYLHGNLFVDGSVAALKIEALSITAREIVVGTATVASDGDFSSTSYTGTSVSTINSGFETVFSLLTTGSPVMVGGSLHLRASCVGTAHSMRFNLQIYADGSWLTYAAFAVQVPAMISSGGNSSAFLQVPISYRAVGLSAATHTFDFVAQVDFYDSTGSLISPSPASSELIVVGTMHAQENKL